MGVVTLGELMTRTRQRSDQVLPGSSTNGFITDAELITLINVGKKALDDILVRSYGEDYFATSVTFVTTAGTENLSLSVLTSGTFYKLLSLSAFGVGPSGWQDVKPYSFKERNLLRSSAITAIPGAVFRYKITGGNLSILPIPAGATRMEMFWIPQTSALSLTTDSFDDVNGWSEFIVCDAAIAIKDKEESDTSVLQADRQREEDRVVASAPNRDAGEPMRVQDVQGIADRNVLLWGGWPR